MKKGYLQSGSTLMSVLIIAVIVNIVFIGLFFGIKSTIHKSGVRRVSSSALNIAEAGKEDLYAQIRSKAISMYANSASDVYSSKVFAGGTYSVRCSTNVEIDSFWIRSRGTKGTSTRTIQVTAAFNPVVPGSPPNVRAAIMARSSVLVTGNINIDGRDYDSLGNLRGNGLFAISSCGTVTLWGSSTTCGGNGITPQTDKTIAAYRSSILQESVSYDSMYESPERALGLPPGALDSYKSSDPLVTPFKALKYSTVDQKSIHFDSSWGILIVHNATKTASLETNGGNFYGLIICDKVPKINGSVNIYGAMIILNDTSIVVSGKGNANVFFSSQILEKIGKFCGNVPRRLEEVAWKEL